MKNLMFIVVALALTATACGQNSGTCENCGVSNQAKKASVQANCQAVLIPVPGVTKYVCPGQCTVVIDERNTLEINSGCPSFP